MSKALPHARQDGLVLRELPEELLVYDLERHMAHCLNSTAAAVWRQCDGKTTPREISARLTGELSEPVEEDVVWLALDDLGNLDLLERPVVRDTVLSRTQLMRRIGVATAAIAVPAVFSLDVPSASAALCFQECNEMLVCHASCPVCDPASSTCVPA
jgi:hypothetical protein